MITLRAEKLPSFELFFIGKAIKRDAHMKGSSFLVFGGTGSSFSLQTIKCRHLACQISVFLPAIKFSAIGVKNVRLSPTSWKTRRYRRNNSSFLGDMLGTKKAIFHARS